MKLKIDFHDKINLITASYLIRLGENSSARTAFFSRIRDTAIAAIRPGMANTMKFCCSGKLRASRAPPTTGPKIPPNLPTPDAHPTPVERLLNELRSDKIEKHKNIKQSGIQLMLLQRSQQKRKGKIHLVACPLKLMKSRST